MYLKLYALLCSCLLPAVFMPKTGSGRVVNQTDNQPVVGATVQEKGTTNATQTGNDGSFTITAPSSATLVVTIVGYNAQEIALNEGLTFQFL